MVKILADAYSRFRRLTSSNLFIPEIDGLRFLAIALVVYQHIAIFVIVKSPFPGIAMPGEYGIKGVTLFFAISGFILGMPFAKHFLTQAPKVDLKKFYLKRLTRLEPPYIIVTLLCFVLLILKGKYGFSEIIAPLGTSLLYLHNIFPLGPYINGVAWSLEIEVQFYLLVPFLASIFMINTYARRIFLASAIVALPFLNHYFPLPFMSLYSFLQYFLTGFLLADFYVSDFKINLNRYIGFLLGLASLLFIVYGKTAGSISGEIIYLALILFFYHQVFHNQWWKKVFSLKILTSIGGMCYTIYLIHVIIMSGVGNLSIHWKPFSGYYPTLFLQMLIIIPLQLAASAVFFLLIEKPCMDRTWPTKLWNYFKRSAGKKDLINAVNV